MVEEFFPSFYNWTGCRPLELCLFSAMKPPVLGCLPSFQEDGIGKWLEKLLPWENKSRGWTTGLIHSHRSAVSSYHPHLTRTRDDTDPAERHLPCLDIHQCLCKKHFRNQYCTCKTRERIVSENTPQKPVKAFDFFGVLVDAICCCIRPEHPYSN